jgi:DNA-binding transcriptional LysR family regulator
MTPTELFALLPDMAVFARVVDAGNFSVAARQLGSTPSTVSRQIKRLEDALATRLLERSTRAVRVTESGAQVARFCRDMVGVGGGRRRRATGREAPRQGQRERADPVREGGDSSAGRRLSARV